jgi:hypothetical protein
LYRRVLMTVSLGLAVLAGCGPLNPGTLVNTNSGSANLRVLNGSPNAGTITATLDSATGPAVVTALAYPNVAAYQGIAAGNHALVITSTTNAFTPMTCPVGLLNSGFSYTMVLAGNAALQSGNTKVQCQVFQEPFYGGTTTSGNYALHNASPAANANGYATLSIGTYPTASPTTFGSVLGTAAFNTTPSTTITNLSTPLSLSASSNGVGFWVVPQGTTPAVGSATMATFLPANGLLASANPQGTKASDSTNLFPTSNLLNLSIYAVDAASGSAGPPFTLVGVFEGV